MGAITSKTMWFFLEKQDLKPLYFLFRQIQAQAAHRPYIRIEPELARDLAETMHKIQGQEYAGTNPGYEVDRLRGQIQEIRAANVGLITALVILGAYIAWRGFL